MQHKAMYLESIDTHAPTWRAALDTIYQELGGGANPTLLPYHFLQAAFPHIGGKVYRVHIDDEAAAILFIFPHLIAEQASLDGLADISPATAANERTPLGAQSGYIARYSVLLKEIPVDFTELQNQLRTKLNTDHVTLYDPTATHPYMASSQSVGLLDIGRPSNSEAAQIRVLQEQIWRSPPEYLYPTDIHSRDFPLGSSLVARVDGNVAGFLFGFYKEQGPPLPLDWQERWHGAMRIESQVMGVLPDYRGLRIGYLLKRIQAQQALTQGIGIIHWTVDPLQYPNAALNFGLLRAVAFNFTPDYYAFRNELNQGPASRFGLTWPIGSARVQAQPLHDARSTVLSLAHHPEIERINNGLRSANFNASAPMLAIEIPANWTKLQRENPEEAEQWRTTTDRLFYHYIGSELGKYVVTDVAVEEERRYLIIQQVTDYLWQRLEET